MQCKSLLCKILIFTILKVHYFPLQDVKIIHSVVEKIKLFIAYKWKMKAELSVRNVSVGYSKSSYFIHTYNKCIICMFLWHDVYILKNKKYAYREK